jgi:hypothetical protein
LEKSFFRIDVDEISLSATCIDLDQVQGEVSVGVQVEKLSRNFRFYMHPVLLNQVRKQDRRTGGVAITVGANVVD